MTRRITAFLLFLPAMLFAAETAIVTITNPNALKIGITDTGTFKVTVTNAKPPALTVTAPATEVVNVVTPGQQGPAGSGSGGGGTWGTITGTLADQIDLKSALDGKHSQSAHSQYSSAVAAQMAGKVNTTDARLTDARTPLAHTQDISTVNGLQDVLSAKVNADDGRLSDARAPLAHNQSASTITGLATVATSGSYNDLSSKPTIPAAQVNTDWNATSGVAQLFNKPTIPAACVDVFDGAPGATGATGSAIFCNISGGIRSHSYDANGVNPSPTPVQFVVQLWHGATRVVASAWQWWTGGSSNRIYGSGTSSTFTPSLKTVFSNVSSNNYVAVQAKYSSAATGRRYCVAGTPIAVSKIGDKGEPGASATVDFASVQTALGAANDGTITLLSSTSTEHTRFQVKNSGSYVVFGITDKGLITVTTPSGTRLWSFTPAGSQMILKTSSGRTIFSVISSAAGGTLKL